MKIYDLLPVGAENAIPKARLVELTGLPERALRAQVQQERRAGHLILTNCTNGGYYLPDHPCEVFPFVRSMRNRAHEINAVSDAVEMAALKAIGQERLEGF